MCYVILADERVDQISKAGVELRRVGYRVDIVTSAADAFALIEKKMPDVLVVGELLKDELGAVVAVKVKSASGSTAKVVLINRMSPFGKPTRLSIEIDARVIFNAPFWQIVLTVDDLLLKLV